jgi:nitrogenase iron protein NifH
MLFVPDSTQAEVYRQLARNVINNKDSYIPKPFEAQDLADCAASWINNLLKEEKIEQNGIRSGSGEGI